MTIMEIENKTERVEIKDSPTEQNNNLIRVTPEGIIIKKNRGW